MDTCHRHLRDSGLMTIQEVVCRMRKHRENPNWAWYSVNGHGQGKAAWLLETCGHKLKRSRSHIGCRGARKERKTKASSLKGGTGDQDRERTVLLRQWACREPSSFGRKMKNSQWLSYRALSFSTIFWSSRNTANERLLLNSFLTPCFLW